MSKLSKDIDGARLPGTIRGGLPLAQPTTVSVLNSGTNVLTRVQPGSDEHDALAGYWSVARRRLGTIAFITLLGGVAGYYLTTLQRPLYRAETSLEVQNVNESFLNIQNVSPIAPSSGVYSQEYDIQTAIRTLQSRSVLEFTLSKDNIRQRLVDAEQAPQMPLLPERLRIRRPSGTDQPIKTIYSALKVKPQTNSRVVDLTVDFSDPVLAADLANAITASYIELSLKKRWDTAESTSKWLTDQMYGLRSKLEQQEADLQKYAQTSGLLFTGNTDNVAEQRLRQLQEEVLRAQADRILKQSRYELVSTAPADSLPEVLDDPASKDDQVALTRLRQQLAELSSSFTSAYPKVVKLNAQIAELEKARDTERTNIANRIRNESDAAQRRESLLQANFVAQARQLSEEAVKVAKYNLLKGEIQNTRQLYDSIGLRVKEAGLVSAVRPSNIQVMDRALPPAKPFSPSKMINTALGLCSGLLIGIVGVVRRGSIDGRRPQPGQISAYLNVPELAVIPTDVRKANWRQLPFRKPSFISTTADDHVELASLRNGGSSGLADSFRAALVSIMGMQTGAWPKIIVVSSALPSEGKTTVISNLAIMLAQLNRRVLLIDGDLRRPRLHDIFGVDNTFGFSDAIARSGPLVFQSTRVPGLSILPCGSKCDPSALFGSGLPYVFKRVRSAYDIVLVDTPPLLQIPDARIIAKYGDAVILTVGAHSATREDVEQSTLVLAQDGIPLLGTILNNYSPQKSDPYYRYRADYPSTRKHG